MDKDYSILDELTPKTEELHRAIFDKGYEQGQKDILEREPCDDLISRQAVEKITWEEPSYTDPLNVLTEIREKVRALPPVTSKEKTGHWIERHYTKLNGLQFSMDVCNQCFEEFSYDRETGIGTYNYCPNCGAKMEVENA